jgi:alpha,alpha-trehalase
MLYLKVGTMVTTESELEEKIKKLLIPKTSEVKRKANGILKYDYLVPGGPYDQLWDWDAYFIGKAISTWLPSEAIYMKNTVLNILEVASDDGFCPGCIRPDGFSKTLRQTKPFAAQGAYFASIKLNDFSWIKPYYEKLKKLVLFRENDSNYEKYGLCAWWNAMESGADNDVSLISDKECSVLSPDLNTFLYLDYDCFSKIAEELGFFEDKVMFYEKSQTIKENINKLLWCEEDDTYYCFDIYKNNFIRAVSYTSMLPLYAGMVEAHRAKKFIERYVLKEVKLLSPFGVRTLNKQHSSYNNENIIYPCSNWQGPVWVIVNYMYCISLSRYGYKEEALDIAHRVIKMCINDIKITGGMHESYSGDTGEPLAAPNFISWNLLLINLCEEIREL